MMTKNLIAIFAFVACLSNAHSEQIQFKTCDVQNGGLDIKTVDVEPYPLIEGKSVAITVNGDSSGDITGGKVTLDVGLVTPPVHIITASDDVCHEVTCPLKAGAVSFKIKQPVPSIGISATLSAKTTISDQSGGSIGCFEMDLKVSTASEYMKETSRVADDSVEAAKDAAKAVSHIAGKFKPSSILSLGRKAGKSFWGK